MKRFGIGLHIAAAAIGVSALALVIVGVGVQKVGGAEFEQLMIKHGASVAAARDMFESSVTVVLLAAVAAAICTTVFLAAWLARWMARPVMRVADAAMQLAAGQYHLRVPESGPREVRSLARSFNQLATELEQQERVRQEFIENAAHELRTPLTNLQGYLEALRDGVIAPGGDKAVAVLSGWREQGVQVVELKTRKVTQTLLQDGAFYGAAFSPDGHHLYVSGGNTDMLFLYSWKDGVATLRTSTNWRRQKPRTARARAIRRDWSFRLMEN